MDQADLQRLYDELSIFLEKGCPSGGCAICTSSQDLCMEIVDIKVKLKKLIRGDKNE